MDVDAARIGHVGRWGAAGGVHILEVVVHALGAIGGQEKELPHHAVKLTCIARVRHKRMCDKCVSCWLCELSAGNASASSIMHHEGPAKDVCVGCTSGNMNTCSHSHVSRTIGRCIHDIGPGIVCCIAGVPIVAGDGSSVLACHARMNVHTTAVCSRSWGCARGIHPREIEEHPLAHACLEYVDMACDSKRPIISRVRHKAGGLQDGGPSNC
mmetsp:Transcript_56283/g.134143  ORF Transcript_56283/g.134143 Transcript_56283/m.134143 type:complete len:212 (-) Transcript_56283:114-749(-)